MAYGIVSEDRQTMHTEFIAETIADLDTIAEATDFDMVFCMEDKKFYIRKPNKGWGQV